MTAREATVRLAGGGFALRDVSLTLRAGASLAVVGGNGAGKTTLARLLTGDLAPDSGDVWFADGVAPGRDTALVSADPASQLLTTSVLDEVAFSLRARRLARDAIIARTEATLAAFGFAGWERLRPADLSVGEQLRLLTAAAVARAPRLLALDEVASMMDGRNWRLIQQAVEGPLRRGELALVVVSHRLDDLAGASRALVLSEGAVALEGALAQVAVAAAAHPAWRIDIPLGYAVWSALDPAARARFSALRPALAEPDATDDAP